jgi:hypothetical protein
MAGPGPLGSQHRYKFDEVAINAGMCRTYKNPAWQALDPLASRAEEYVLTAGDDGHVRIFNYPSVVEYAPNRCGPWYALH